MIQKMLRLPITILLGRGYWPIASREGLRLYRINFLRWENTAEVEFKKILFLPHFKVRLHSHQMPIPLKQWYFPLYFWGVEEFISNLRIFAPENSPFTAAVSEENIQKLTMISPQGLCVLAVLTIVLGLGIATVLSQVIFVLYLLATFIL